MKKLVMMILMLLPMMAFAQSKVDLTPKVMKDDKNKTYFMWDVVQAKEIATKISDGEKDKAKVAALEEKNDILKKTSEAKDKKIDALNSDNKTLEGMVSDQKEIIRLNGEIITNHKQIEENQAKTIVNQDKKIKRRGNTIKVLAITNTVTAAVLAALVIIF
jgi:hypothetical protein